MSEDTTIRITIEDLDVEQSGDTTIRITPEELGEVSRPQEVIIREDVIEQLNTETKDRDLEGRREFLTFLLGMDSEVTETVEVGIGHRSGIIAPARDVIAKLRPYVDRGYKVIADYHNHPHESVSDYQIAGYPVAFALSPSTTDLTTEVTTAVQTELRQEPYPRIIAAYSEEDSGVLMNAFNILRIPTQDEQDAIEFQEPIVIHQVADENGIRMLPASYTNPRELIERGIIEPIRIKASLNSGGHMNIPNSLQNALI